MGVFFGAGLRYPVEHSWCFMELPGYCGVLVLHQVTEQVSLTQTFSEVQISLIMR